MVNGITLEAAKKAFVGKKVYPAWLPKKFGEIILIREIPKSKNGDNLFIATLDNGFILNLEVLKDNNDNYLYDIIGGILDSIHDNEGK